MEINKILNSDLLDIIFEGRNKDYGAYDLRKTYNDRLMKAGIVTLVTILLLVTGYLFASKFSNALSPDVIVDDFKLIEVPKVEPREVVVPPQIKTEPPKVAIVKYVVPIIVKDQDVPDDQKLPEVKELDNKVIGLINSKGVDDDGTEAPPAVADNRGIIIQPKSDLTDDDRIFRKVEIESLYPGGPTAWMRYLNKTFRYPSDAQENNLQGTVTVQFIVDMDGNVSNVEAVSGPEKGGLREEAVRVIMKSGKWEPAIQNGRKVKSYKKQPITFKLESE